MIEEEIKFQLMSSNREFRRLAEEHTEFEGKLHELNNRHCMTEQDHLDEITFKKRKLHLKDEMNAMMEKYRHQLSHQHT